MMSGLFIGIFLIRGNLDFESFQTTVYIDSDRYDGTWCRLHRRVVRRCIKGFYQNKVFSTNMSRRI